ncbi:M10 family metallopeptidase C-terminal domain-containing protein [Cereibacter sphaeroides]|uniref:M10 family metallopeptidase n=1 Tax=Cereibacter sphaeroides TaxID=1063 RepID=UPI001F42CF24|nr:M10 family metallopeptidase [Cereibacter sphaeroides]MCE6961784.1 M10 family metallopeptidase C-terminal domain-containing protein [Cereibacter sphaeroides]MCE6970559.1 M10 family metallopeptidase C-terminal domain-containing protein [Cereibacter sphaeroides]MCE6971863.1 M10 family metallopeptidase C-terminal domain-containing protein [Cereibacter sphaeroides]
MSLSSPFESNIVGTTEGAEVPVSPAIPYGISPGLQFSGTLDRMGDADFIGIRLVAGETFSIGLAGSGVPPGPDTFVRLHGQQGGLLASDDDGGRGLNSRHGFTAAITATFQIQAASDRGDHAERYSLSAFGVAEPTVFTKRQIADQLVNGYWEATGRSSRSFDVGQGDTLNVDLSDLTAAGQRLASVALQTWSAVTGIRFDTTPNAGASIHIHFDDVGSGAHGGSTYSGSKILSSEVNVSRAWLTDNGTGLNSYSLQTYIHEIGHALGLGHAGNYNGDAQYGIDNHYANDSWQATVMSYFSQIENTYIHADYAHVVTPMIADILAIQTLYGPTRNIRGGDTVYGDNSNAGGMYSQIAGLPGEEVAWTIFDQGGHDVIDLRSATEAQRIDLRPGTVSNVYGAVGNLSIAMGTTIEVARGGSGNDRIIGNSAANGIRGGAGADVFVFTSALGNGNVDRIVDFRVVDDTIRLENHIFSGLSEGWLSSRAFARNATGRAADSSDRIIYETDTGNLLYDRDGLGGSAAVRFAVLPTGLNLTNADFFVG